MRYDVFRVTRHGNEFIGSSRFFEGALEIGNAPMVGDFFIIRQPDGKLVYEGAGDDAPEPLTEDDLEALEELCEDEYYEEQAENDRLEREYNEGTRWNVNITVINIF